MYRLKRNSSLINSLNVEFEKAATRTVLFSIVAVVLKTLDAGNNKISVLGVTLELKEHFFLSGAFCALAIFYCVEAVLLSLKLHGAGWPSNYELYYKRYLFRRRNREGDTYDPLRAKKRVWIKCALMNAVLCIVAVPLVSIYVYGIIKTLPDLGKIVALIVGGAT